MSRRLLGEWQEHESRGWDGVARGLHHLATAAWMALIGASLSVAAALWAITEPSGKLATAASTIADALPIAAIMWTIWGMLLLTRAPATAEGAAARRIASWASTTYVVGLALGFLLPYLAARPALLEGATLAAGTAKLAAVVLFFVLLRTVAVRLGRPDIARSILIYVLAVLGAVVAAVAALAYLAIVTITSLPDAGTLLRYVSDLAAPYGLVLAGSALVGVILFGWYIRLLTDLRDVVGAFVDDLGAAAD